MIDQACLQQRGAERVDASPNPMISHRKSIEHAGVFFAFLQVDDVFFNWQDVKASRKTKRLTGDHDWTRLEVEFTPSPRDPFLLIKLCVEGTGTAWFDDLELMEVAR